MTSVEEAQKERHERKLLALKYAQHDVEFRNFLRKRNYSPEMQDECFKKIRQLIEGGANCKAIRILLNGVLKGKALEAASDYRRALALWIEQKEDTLPNPPNWMHERLPKLAVKTLPDYFWELERIANRLHDGQIEQDSFIPLQQSGANSIPEKQFDGGALANLKYQLKKFIDQGEEEAAHVLTFVLGKRNPNEHTYFAIELYFDLFVHCLEKLKRNPHAMASLIHLMYEEFKKNTEALKHTRLTGQHTFTLMIEGLKRVGVAHEVSTADFYLKDPGSPRKSAHFSYEHKYLRAGQIGAIAIPVEQVPSSWNEHRLVDPRKSEAFKAFLRMLEQGKATLAQNELKKQLALYKEALKKERIYSLEYDEVKVSEIPAPPGYEIWFHYFYDDRLPPGYIGIELILKHTGKNESSSVVYIMDRELNLISPANIPIEKNKSSSIKDDEKVVTTFFHPVKPELSGGESVPRAEQKSQGYVSVEDMYLTEKENLYQWADQDMHELLKYYFAKYAYYILVHEGGSSRAKKTSDQEKHPLSLSLKAPSASTVIIPREDFVRDGVGQKASFQVIRHERRAHFRPLPLGHYATEAAIAAAKEAERHGMRPMDPKRETFVRGYRAGSILAPRVSYKKTTE